MTHALSSPLRISSTVFALMVAATLAVRDAGAQERSPFIPSGFGAPAAPAAPVSSLDRFEFRGVMRIGDATFIALLDTSNQRSISLVEGEVVDGLVATDYRPEDGSIQLESGGQTKRVKLREAKIVAMATPPPQPPPQPNVQPGMPGQPGGPAVAGAPISDEEARVRMQRVAEEIRRRREMRRQMLETQQQQQQAPQPGRPAANQ